MILLDTTVLIYSVGKEHPLREPCRRLLEAHARRLVRCTTTIEVVQEFAHAYGRSRPRQVTVELARRYATAFDLLMTGPRDLEVGLGLYERHPELGAFDAVLAAVALNHEIEALVSADRGFAAVPRLPWLEPTAAATRL